MAVALEAVDIVALCACLVLLALLMLAAGLTRAIAGAIDVDILGSHPFGGIASALRNHVLNWINSAIGGVESAITTLLYGLIWSFDIVRKGITDLANGIEGSLRHAWTGPLHATFAALYAIVHRAIEAVDNRVTSLVKAVADEFVAVKHFATSEANHALSSAQAYADHWINHAVSSLNTRITAVEGTIESELKGDIHDVREVTNNIVRELRAAEASAEQVADFPTDLLGELNRLAERYGNAASIGALLAAVPLLAKELATFEKETGMEDPQCRSNLRGLCGVDPFKWGSMLAGLLVVGTTFDLKELAGIARGVMDEGAKLISEVK